MVEAAEGARLREDTGAVPDERDNRPRLLGQEGAFSITGHTGFKGAWLSLWLRGDGGEGHGPRAGPADGPSLYELARVGEGCASAQSTCATRGRCARPSRRSAPRSCCTSRRSRWSGARYREPALTYEVNVMGTVNVLEAVRHAGDAVRAVVVVTSDKCYENPAGGARCFVEGDPLGGEDPYSSSKACAELVTAAYRASFFAAGDADPGASATGTRIASARAGNVIGGGDWGADRLIPDIVRAVEAGEPVKVRNPGAVRPWQHVLNPLSGYLALARELCRTSTENGSGARDVAGAWNFGPAVQDARTVGWVVQRLAEHWGGAFAWEADGEQGPPEAGHLALDSAARRASWTGARHGISIERWRAWRGGTRPFGAAPTYGRQLSAR